MISAVLAVALIGNPPIYIVVEESQVRSQIAVQDMTRDFSRINPKIKMTPREEARYHCKVRKLNKIRSEITSEIIFLKADDVEPLKEYPQYKMGKRGKWYPFPKQAFLANGWFLLTVARLSDEWSYSDREKEFKRRIAKEYEDMYEAWRKSIKSYMEERIDCDEHREEAIKCIKEVDGTFNWYINKTLHEIYHDYSLVFPKMPFYPLFCPKFPARTWLPYEFDIYKHEGYKLKTEESYGVDN